jgi:hypothetical protein
MGFGKVMIVKRGDRAIVWPPYLAVAEGDYITFVTVGVSAKIEFPVDLPFEENGSTHSPTEDKPKWAGVENAQGGHEAIIRVQPDSSVTVKLKAADKSSAKAELRSDDSDLHKYAETMLFGETQVYAYSVFCMEINDFAEGNSSPVIMIEPPERPPGP